jgi:flavin-dependent dehydrogenase
MQRSAVWSPSAYYDALVFGNGPAACIFAIQMTRRGKSVLLIPPPLTESSPKPWGETLAPRGEFLLAQLGLANGCLAGQHATQTMLACWQNVHPEATNLAFDPHGQMWHLNRLTFDKALLTHALASGADIIDRKSCCIASIDRRSDRWEVRLKARGCKRIADVGHLVDATGKSSYLARRMGSKRVCRDQLVAVFGILEEPSKSVLPLLIEPVCGGWWYSLGLPQGTLLVAFITDPRLVRVTVETRRSVWDRMLDDAPYTRSRIGVRESSLSVVSVESSRLDRITGEGWLAIGDAATSFDPLSSHGLCSAIEQAVWAAEALCLGTGSSLTEFEVKCRNAFEKYATQRIVFYGKVRRLSKSAFWQKRTSIPS